MVVVLGRKNLLEVGLGEWWVAEALVRTTLEDPSSCCSQWMQASVSEVLAVGCLVLACLCPTQEINEILDG